MNYLDMDSEQLINELLKRDADIQALRKDAEEFKSGLKILIPTLEHIANEVDIDLDETRIAVNADNKELVSVSIGTVITKLRAAMEKQP